MRSTEQEIRWAPRVRPEKIRRLYELEARGLVDAELIDEIGTALYCRCRDSLVVSDAAEGRARCPRCGELFARRGDDKQQIVGCSSCGWQSRWIDYQKTYQHQELYARGATAELVAFMRGWERAASAREKMLLIDRLIHTWHWEARKDRQVGRPTAVNLIEGSRRQVLAFLDELSRGRSGRSG